MSRGRPVPTTPELERRLSIIDEDDVRPTQLKPPKASHRPFNRRWRDDPPRHSFEAPPPQYNVWDDVHGPRGEKLKDLRNNRHLVRRGGWLRLCIIFLLVLSILVALGVGLGMGLAQRASQNSQSDGQSTSQPFPAGVYSIPTFLAAANTDCTRNPSTWRCFPYTVYDASPAMSAVTFFWNISHAAENNSFSISSSNPFSINFQNAVLSFLDADTPQERYHFSISIGQTIIPSTPISNDGTAAVCNFNSTVLEGNLYTRKPPDPRSTNTTSKDAESWAVWPHAVEVYQRVGGGPGIPSCYKTSNGQTMGKITEGLEPMPSNDICQCSYKNFDL